MPGLLASAAALGAGARLGGSPEAPAGGIFWPDYPHTESLQRFPFNILQVVHLHCRKHKPVTIWRSKTSQNSRLTVRPATCRIHGSSLQDVGPYQQLFGACSNPPRVFQPFDDSKFSKPDEKLCLHSLAGPPRISLNKTHHDRHCGYVLPCMFAIMSSEYCGPSQNTSKIISAVDPSKRRMQASGVLNCKVWGLSFVSTTRCDDTPATRQRHVTL